MPHRLSTWLPRDQAPPYWHVLFWSSNNTKLELNFFDYSMINFDKKTTQNATSSSQSQPKAGPGTLFKTIGMHLGAWTTVSFTLRGGRYHSSSWSRVIAQSGDWEMDMYYRNDPSEYSLEWNCVQHNFIYCSCTLRLVGVDWTPHQFNNFNDNCLPASKQDILVFHMFIGCESVN